MKTGEEKIDFPKQFLNQYAHIDFITGVTLEELQGKIKAINFPFFIKSMYFDGNNHVAWILSTKTLNKGN